MTTLTSLVSHEHWANHRLADALHESGPPSAEAVRIFNHILGAHDTWHARVTESAAALPVWDAEIESRHWGQLIDAQFERWKHVLRTEEPSKKVVYANTRGVRFTNTLEEILTHLSMHGQYHRGQIIQQFRVRWDIPPATDFILFLRESEPAL